MELRLFLFLLLLPWSIIAGSIISKPNQYCKKEVTWFCWNSGAAERRLISLLLEEGQEYNPMVCTTKLWKVLRKKNWVEPKNECQYCSYAVLTNGTKIKWEKFMEVNRTEGAHSSRRGLWSIALQLYGSPPYAIFHIPDNKETLGNKTQGACSSRRGLCGLALQLYGASGDKRRRFGSSQVHRLVSPPLYNSDL